MRKTTGGKGERGDNKRTGVTRSGVGAWKAGGGPGEGAETWRRERRRPTEVTTQTRYKTEGVGRQQVQDEDTEDNHVYCHVSMLGILTHPSP